MKGLLNKLKKFKPKYKPDLSLFNEEVDDMWDILGLQGKRVNQLVEEIDNVLKLHHTMTYKKLFFECIKNLPKNPSELNFLVFHMGQRWEVLQQKLSGITVTPHSYPLPTKKEEQLIN